MVKDKNKLRTVLLLVILLNSAYLRGFSLPIGVTTSYLLIIWISIGLIIIAIAVVRNKYVVLVDRWWLWITLIASFYISFIYNMIFQPNSLQTLQFGAEFSLNILLFFAILGMSSKDIIGSVYRGFVAASAMYSVMLVSYPIMTGVNNIYRLGGYQISGAVNNISQMIAVAIIIAIVGLINGGNLGNKKTELLSLPILLVTLILTGSRAAIIGLILSFGILFIIGKTQLRDMAFIFVTAIAGILVLFFSPYNLTGLYRFGIDSLLVAINNRLTDYSIAVQEAVISIFDVIFGGGMYRYAEVTGPNISTIPYPHNYIISLYVHIGLPTALIFSIIIITTVRGLFIKNYSSDGVDYVTLCTLLALIVILMYSFTSGRVTRTFPLWIFLGISANLPMTTIRK